MHKTTDDNGKQKGDYVINLSKIMNGMEIYNLQNCFQYITLSICLCILAEIFQALSLQGNFMNINSVGEWLIQHFCSLIASTLMLKIATWKHVILEPISESIRWSNLFVWSSLVTELWSSGSSFWHVSDILIGNPFNLLAHIQLTSSGNIFTF